MNATDVLGKVFHLFDDKKRWTVGSVARDSDDEPTNIDQAVKWCALGAIAKFTEGDRASYERAVWALACELQPVAFFGKASGATAFSQAEVLVYKTNDQPGGLGHERIRGAIQQVLQATEAPKVEQPEREPALV